MCFDGEIWLYIYIYIYVCVCVCVCLNFEEQPSRRDRGRCAHEWTLSWSISCGVAITNKTMLMGPYI
jgi:hypothetical protein